MLACLLILAALGLRCGPTAPHINYTKRQPPISFSHARVIRRPQIVPTWISLCLRLLICPCSWPTPPTKPTSLSTLHIFPQAITLLSLIKLTNTITPWKEKEKTHSHPWLSCSPNHTINLEGLNDEREGDGPIISLSNEPWKPNSWVMRPLGLTYRGESCI